MLGLTARFRSITETRVASCRTCSPRPSRALFAAEFSAPQSGRQQALNRAVRATH